MCKLPTPCENSTILLYVYLYSGANEMEKKSRSATLLVAHSICERRRERLQEFRILYETAASQIIL